MIKAVIFDLDGTLLDSEKLVIGAYRHVFAKYGMEFDEKIIRTYIGRTLEHTYGRLIPSKDSKNLAILHRDWQIERIHIAKGYSGLRIFLETLSNKGLKLGIFTSSSRMRVNAIFNSLELSKFFDVVLCGDEVINAKPHHEGVSKVMNQLNVLPNETIMVGDAEHDILSGKNAGSTTIGITHGFGTKQSLKDAGADYLVNDLKELLILIQKMIK